MSSIDLHLHTTASDGKLSLRDLVNRAIKDNAKIIAITDHDSLASLKEIKNYNSKKITIIPGIEISCEKKETDLNDIHIIGLFINPSLSPSQAVLNITLWMQL